MQILKRTKKGLGILRSLEERLAEPENSVISGKIRRVNAFEPAHQKLLEFCSEIEAAIKRVTNSQVQTLSVLPEPTSIIIRGYCNSFYIKQLAQEAVMRIVKNKEIINEIHVY
ncbi:MAG: hypothetical protein LBQ54_03570 [Planctomycetaceae bacterium]|jgi:hypothetical protein|nr:hypothetical protein [Planctomycetaceae bacterium]